MRIGIDLTALIEKPTGVDRYLIGLASSLAKYASSDEYVLFINAEDRVRVEKAVNGAAGVRVVALSRRPRALRIFSQQALLPVAVRRMRIDVVHSPAFIMPFWRGRAAHMLTVQDMTSFLVPRLHPGSRHGRDYEMAVAASVRRADIVTVPSPSVRDDVLRLVPGLPPDHVRSIPYGVDDVFAPRPPDEVAAALDRMGVRRPYILYVGTLDPRKNLPRLVEAYARLTETQRAGARLALAGQFGWTVSELLESLKLPSVRDRVDMLGYVPEEQLPFLYAGARAFVYPSLLEGFGFPPLEAMACGAPVIASDSSSLRDNLAGAAMLVPPGDVEALTAAIASMLTDEQLRARYIATGLERSASFRWDAFARATSACYHEIAERKHRP